MRPITLALLLAFSLPVAPPSALAQNAESAPSSMDGTTLKKEVGKAMEARDWPNVATLAERLVAQEPQNAAGYSLLGAALSEMGDASRAIPNSQRAIELQPDNANNWGNLCWTLILANQPDKAQAACEKASNLEPNGWSIQVNLGHTFLLRGDNKTAQDWYQKSLLSIDNENDLKNGPLADFDVFISRGWQVEASRVARAWFEKQGYDWLKRKAPANKMREEISAAESTKDFARSLTLREQSLPLLLALYGEQHPISEQARSALTITRDKLADQLYAQGHYADALRLYQQTLSVHKATGNSSAIVSNLINIAQTYQKIGNYSEAESFFIEAQEISERINGPDHAELANILKLRLRLMTENQKQEPNAKEALLRRLLAMREKKLGKDHPGTANDIFQLANFLERRTPLEAETLYRHLLSILISELGPLHGSVATVTIKLADTLAATERNSEAERILLNLLSIIEKPGTNANQKTMSERERLSWMGQSLYKLSEMQGKLKRNLDAEHNFSRMLDVLEKAFSNIPLDASPAARDPLESFDWAANAAEFRLLSILGIPSEQAIRQAIAIRTRIFGPMHSLTVEAESILAKRLLRNGYNKEAEAIIGRTIAFRTKNGETNSMLQSMDINHLGQIRLQQGNLSEAEALFRLALQINEKIDNNAEAALISLGQTMIARGRFEEAEQILQRALYTIRSKKSDNTTSEFLRKMREVLIRPNETAAEWALALNWIAAGNFSKAITSLQNYIVANDEKTTPLEFIQGYALLAGAYGMAGDEKNAASYARRVLVILDDATTMSSLEKTSLIAQVATFLPHEEGIQQIRAAVAAVEKSQGTESNSSWGLISLGALLPPEDGIPILKRALIAANMQSDYLAAQVSALLGMQMMFDPQTALEAEKHLSHAEHVFVRSASITPMLVWTRYFLAMHYSMSEQNDLAIFYGKLAVNGMQQLRSLNAGLSKELQGKFVGQHTKIYKLVSNLLVDEGRIPEAQQILAMLKEDELHEFTQRNSAEDPRKTKADFDGHERLWAKRYEKISKQVVDLAQEYDSLQKKYEVDLTTDDKARLVRLDADLTVARQAYDAFMVDLKREFTQSTSVKRAKNRDEDYGAKNLETLAALQGTLESLGHGAVTLHYLMTDKRLWILLTTPTVQLKREAAISEAELNRQIGQYREAITRREPKIKEMGKALYDILIGPVANDLKQADAQTLMLSLDGGLRYLPMAALYDGEQYLAQRFQLALFTEAAKDKLSMLPKAKWRFAAFGLTEKVANYDALPSVKGELEGMSSPAFAGDIKFDKEFTASAFKTALARRPPVVHLASHFVFRAGTEADSFLLLGDGTPLSLKAIKEENFRFTDVDLLTLSACETAVGGGKDANGREVEGFGALAQNQGAKGVMATLWPVADESTGQFMQLFYGIRQKNPGMTKAAAMQKAQLAFIEGRVGAALAEVSRGAKRTGGPTANPAVNTTDHPYFWAPFILMGNWL